MERQQIKNYESVINLLLSNYNKTNHSLAIEIAGLPLRIRGFGHVKDQARKETQAYEKRLLTNFKNKVSNEVDVAI